MTDEQVTLLPCPFCGSGEVSMSFSATLWSADPAARFVECEVCAVSGPNVKIEAGDDSAAKIEASKKWNSRIAHSQASEGDFERAANVCEAWLDPAKTIIAEVNGLSDRDIEVAQNVARGCAAAIRALATHTTQKAQGHE